jgi:hypothetical protein
VSERIFAELVRPREDGYALVGYDTTRRKVLEGIAACRKRLCQPVDYSQPAKQDHDRPAVVYLNQIIHGDCCKLISELADNSIAAVITPALR